MFWVCVGVLCVCVGQIINAQKMDIMVADEDWRDGGKGGTNTGVILARNTEWTVCGNFDIIVGPFLTLFPAPCRPKRAVC